MEVNADPLSKELRFGDGYAVIRPRRKCQIENFRDKLLLKTNADTIDTLRRSLVTVSNAELNEIMVKLLGFTEASGMLAEAFSEQISALCGYELFLQRRANIIMNLPGINQRHQWPHYELMSGISPSTYAIWLPLHNLTDDGGMFYVPDKESFDVMRHEYDQGVVNSPYMFKSVGYREVPKLEFGEALIFNPFVIHGNMEFNASLARIAVSFRFQSRSDPLYQKNSDFLKTWTLKRDESDSC